jgi:hypothetical protein
MAAPDTLMASLPVTILVIDIGGSKVKMLATGETAPRKCRSGKRLTLDPAGGRGARADRGLDL